MDEQEEEKTFKKSLQVETCSIIEAFQSSPSALSRQTLGYMLCEAIEKFDGS